MGNCLNPASKARRHGGMPPPEDMDDEEGWCYATPEPASAATATATATTIGHLLREEPAEEEDQEDEEETAASAAAAAGMKVKVVLKRAELEWLMSQLKTGDRRLEDVLNQMATARALSAAPPPPPHRAGDGWRPRLECILECHELAAAT